MSNVYDMTDDFDKAITRLSHVPSKPAFIIDAAVEVHDTLKLANISAKTIFGDDVSPEIAVKISDRLEAKRVLFVNEFHVNPSESESNQLSDAWLKSGLAANKMAESIDCAGAKAPLADEIKLTVLPLEKALSALKACWLRLHPQHTEAEYVAAINEFERLVGF